jgi:signal transduction histidine kinase
MNIRTTLVALFLSISILPLTILGVINYHNAELAITDETINKLNTLASEEEEGIKIILQHNQERLLSFVTRAQLKIELDKFNTSGDVKSLDFMNNLLSSIKSQIPSIREISVLNPEGVVVASTVKDELAVNHANDEFFLKGKQSNDITIFFMDDNVPSLYLTGPLILDGKLVGVAALTSDVASIYSITGIWKDLTKTGESFLVMRDQNGDGLVLTPLRFEPDAVLNTRISKDEPFRPATQALLGNEITMTDSIDYRGMQVLAVTKYIEEGDLGLVVKIDKEEAVAPLNNLKYLTAIVSTIGILAVITASFYLGKSLSSPVRRLRDKVNEISKGNFDLGLHKDTIGSKWHDEIGELALRFDDMRKSIKSMNENLQQLVQEKTKELEAANNELKGKNTSLQSLNKVLQEQKKQLREVDNEKEEFSAMITHELKTPLVPIIGYSELLLDGTLGQLNEKQKESIQVMNNSAASLSRLISDLLDARKLELGKMKFEKRDASPTIMVEQSLSSLQPFAQAKGVTMTSKTEQESSDRLIIRCDAKRIRQVLDNLVNNAIKFVAANTGKIEVSVKRESDSGTILFAVKDNGIGIPKDKHQNIFKKFYQADTSLTRNAGGTGLGLAICKAIIGAHDGKIWFESEPGVGSTFYFSLPPGLKSTTVLPTEKKMSQESLTS